MSTGNAYPVGVTLTPSGVNFSLFSAHARCVHLLLFDTTDAPHASRVIELDPVLNRTGHYWHIEVLNITAGQAYAYRVDGPYNPEFGYRFDSTKVLLDP